MAYLTYLTGWGVYKYILGNACDSEMLDALLDEADVELPRSLALEAIDRAIALTVVDMFCNPNRYLFTHAPSL